MELLWRSIHDADRVVGLSDDQDRMVPRHKLLFFVGEQAERWFSANLQPVGLSTEELLHLLPHLVDQKECEVVAHVPTCEGRGQTLWREGEQI